MASSIANQFSEFYFFVDHGLMVTTRGAAYLGGIFPLADLVKGHEPLSGTGMGGIHRLLTKFLWVLLPAGCINFQHGMAERDWQLIYIKS